MPRWSGCISEYHHLSEISCPLVSAPTLTARFEYQETTRLDTEYHTVHDIIRHFGMEPSPGDAPLTFSPAFFLGSIIHGPLHITWSVTSYCSPRYSVGNSIGLVSRPSANTGDLARRWSSAFSGITKALGPQ